MSGSVKSLRASAFFAFVATVAVVASALIGTNVASADSIQVQSYQRGSESEACTAQPGETPWQASWGPDSSWSPSWEQWANSGSGGWVCTRSITWARTPVTPIPEATSTAPTGVTAMSGDTTVALTWVAPTDTGGVAIIGYSVQISTIGSGTFADAGGCAAAATSTALACTSTALTNGTAYIFMIAAITGVGTGAFSSTSASVTPTAPVLSCATGGPCVVGDTGPGDGEVFYVAGSVQAWGQYLEMAPKNWSGDADPMMQWSGNISDDVSGTTGSIGAGATNTALMIAQSNTPNRASTASVAYRGGGKTDWFLPSLDELNAMCNYSRTWVGSPSTGTCTGLQNAEFALSDYGFANGDYWSSSQMYPGYALYLNFESSAQNVEEKGQYFRVRPVRAF